MLYIIAVQFRETVSLGSIVVAGLVGIVGLMTLFYGAKWKSLYNLEVANAKAWEATAHRFETELHIVKER